MKLLRIFAFWGLFLPNPTLALDLTKANSIWDMKSGKQIKLTQFINDLASKRVILLGENHGNSGHQNREAFIIGALAEREIFPAIGLEMLTEDNGSVVEAFREHSPEETSGLGEALLWSSSGWPDYTYYQPVFDAAFHAKLNIFGVDLDESAKKFAGEEPLPSGTNEELVQSWAASMTEAHCGIIDGSELEKVTRLQVRRDIFMAERMKTIGLSVLVAGSEHVRKDRGIPKLLADTGIDLAAIAFVPASAETNNKQSRLTTYSFKKFDYVWVTEAENRLSTCERLRQKGLIK